MKRRLSGLALALLLLVSLAACGESGGNTPVHGGSSGGLIDLPVQEPDKSSQGPDGSQGSVPDDSQAPSQDGGSGGHPPAQEPDKSSQAPDGGQGNVPDDNQNPSNGGEGNVNPSDGKGDDGNKSVDKSGWYTSKEEVALYIHLYGELPGNYVTKKEAEEAGWSGGSVERYTGEGTAIGGSYFGNREGLLPKAKGRTYTECDIDTPGRNTRGAKRIVYSNDGLVYYTDDHYESFELLYGEP